MRIIGLEACTLVVPLARTVRFSTRTLRERHYTVVRVRTVDGVQGTGFCYSGNKAGHLVTLIVRDLLRDQVLGRDSNQVEQIWEAMYREALLQGRRGAVMRAMSAIDLALWDANAKAAGLPLYRYLGAYRETTVPAYASGGYYADGTTASDVGRETQTYVEMGFSAVKMKVGRLTPEEDAQRIAAARDAVGPGVRLFLDANNAWSDLPSARRAIRMWERWKPDWVEEPFMPDEIDLHAMLASSVSTPIATGEIENGRWGFKALLEKRGAAILQPDAGVCGGITEWRRIAAIAHAYGVPVAPHWLAEVHVHLVAATPNATWVEYFPDTNIANWPLCFQTQLQVSNGALVLPDSPGLGIHWDAGAIARYSLDGWK
jgi:L-alanine-DL-glutamate epimerase-like enolase superfamily enzyme